MIVQGLLDLGRLGIYCCRVLSNKARQEWISTVTRVQSIAGKVRCTTVPELADVVLDAYRGEGDTAPQR